MTVSNPEEEKREPEAFTPSVVGSIHTELPGRALIVRSLSSKSETAAAIRYALSRWRALARYTDYGLLEIDNSAAERALRAVALGRKNFLFAGSDHGGKRAAAMYTLIGSAKLNGIDPELY